MDRHAGDMQPEQLENDHLYDLARPGCLGAITCASCTACDLGQAGFPERSLSNPAKYDRQLCFDEDQALHTGKPENKEAWQSFPRILLVEDNDINQTVARSLWKV